MFAGPPLTMGHSKELNQMGLGSFFLTYHTLVHFQCELSVMTSPSWSRSFIWILSGTKKGGQKSFLSLSFLKNTQLKIINIPNGAYLGVASSAPPHLNKMAWHQKKSYVKIHSAKNIPINLEEHILKDLYSRYRCILRTCVPLELVRFLDQYSSKLKYS